MNRLKEKYLNEVVPSLKEKYNYAQQKLSDLEADYTDFLNEILQQITEDKKYNFEEKFNSLLNISRQKLENEINKGFISLPKGCYITLEKKATEYILENIKAYFGKNIKYSG